MISAATATLIPKVCALAINPAITCTRPKASGYCVNAPKKVASKVTVSGAAITNSIPKLAARPLITSIV